MNHTDKHLIVCWANTSNYYESDVVILGIPNEIGSKARRKGTAKAPSTIRSTSNSMDDYSHGRTKSLAVPINGSLEPKVYDYGNITKGTISKTISKISKSSKIPISLGGDHSNTTEIIKGLARKGRPISLAYFDAHPDFVSSRGSYYGSVVYDCLPHIDVKSSVLVGIRSPEQEELDNITGFGLEVITPLEIAEMGIKQTIKKILSIVGKNTYISFDMDCIDPSFAPGVSVPVPFGLSSLDVLYFIRKIAEKGIIGMDIMEVNPSFDQNFATSHLASRLIGETISALRYN